MTYVAMQNWRILDMSRRICSTALVLAGFLSWTTPVKAFSLGDILGEVGETIKEIGDFLEEAEELVGGDKVPDAF